MRWLAIGCLCFVAQAQTAKLEFEAASVKPAVPLGPMGMRSEQNGGPGTKDPGLFTCRNCSLYWLLNDAYGEPPYKVSAPDWMQSVRFDVSARLPERATGEQFQAMMQNLLAERFKLAVHREKREMGVFELTVAKGGPKFRDPAPAPKDDPSRPLQKDAEGYPILPEGTTLALSTTGARLRSDNQPMAWFVKMIENHLQGPVVDATGLPGKYSFIVSWNPNPMRSTDGAEFPGPDLVTAIQTQLGLKLEKKKGMVEMLVVDHAEKTPAQN